MQIDARGKACPVPVLMAEEALSTIKEGIVEVIVDNEESAMNLSGYAAQNALFAEINREDRDWKVRIVKGYACQPKSNAGAQIAEPETKKNLFCSLSGPTAWARTRTWAKSCLKVFSIP